MKPNKQQSALIDAWVRRHSGLVAASFALLVFGSMLIAERPFGATLVLGVACLVLSAACWWTLHRKAAALADDLRDVSGDAP